jgi:hypothetical protein
MKTITTTLLFLSWVTAFSQNFKEKELKSEVKEVTVFLTGAQIFEAGTTSLLSGNSILKVKGLSPFIDEKSIQVKGQGDFTILSVNHKLNYLDVLKKDGKADSLKKLMEGIDLFVLKEQGHLAVLQQKQTILDENRKLGTQTIGVTVAQIKQTLEFYEAEVSKIKEDEIKTNGVIEAKKKERIKFEQQLKELNELKPLPTSEIEIRVNADASVIAKFTVTYLVSNAGWYPKYDIRVHSIKAPLELTYKAEVFQNTGVDWKNVKLRFSNGDPNQSGVVPELNTWNLNFARNTVFEKSIYGISTLKVRTVKGSVVSEDGEPLPGVNVVVKGTTVGTVTDGQGNYSLTLPNDAVTLVFSFVGLKTEEVPIDRSDINLQLKSDVAQLSEVVVTAYGASSSDALEGRASGVMLRGMRSIDKSKYKDLITIVKENQTTVEIEVATPYSIKSNGDKLQVELKKHDVEALYEYYAIPKLDKDAFLVAKVIHWDQYNLLEGEANLYFEEAFVGRSILDAKSLQDTLNISLGRDRSIVINRVKNEQFSKRKTMGGNVTEMRGFKTTIRNKKSQPIKLILFDQIPVSVISDISVNPIDLSKGQFSDKTGKVSWELNIDAQQQKEINLQYEVKYPKRERVMLE